MRKVIGYLVCSRCGKQFILKSGDAIFPDTAKQLYHPLCVRCRIIRYIRFLEFKNK